MERWNWVIGRDSKSYCFLWRERIYIAERTFLLCTGDRTGAQRCSGEISGTKKIRCTLFCIDMLRVLMPLISVNIGGLRGIRHLGHLRWVPVILEGIIFFEWVPISVIMQRIRGGLCDSGQPSGSCSLSAPTTTANQKQRKDREYNNSNGGKSSRDSTCVTKK